MNQPVISIKGLKKRFAKHKRLREIVLKGLDLEVGRGIVALLGPNGAGKSTLLRVISGLVAAEEGRVLVFGRAVGDYGQSLNERVTLVVGEERSFYYQLTARQNLEFFAAMGNLFGEEARSEIDRVLGLVDLTSESGKPFADMSSGMKQRLSLARGLLTNPDILMFDEITRGLDPGHASRFRTLVKETLSRTLGKTILFATHNLEEAKELADTLVLMDRGLIVAAGSYDAVAPQFDRVFGICGGGVS